MDILSELSSISALCNEQRISYPLSDQQIAIDGKALQGTSSKSNNLTCLNFVNAWCYENGIVLGQTPTQAKSNEIKAIPELLVQLMLRGSLISIDKKISSKSADYLIALKANQPTFYEFSMHLPIYSR